MTSTLRPDEMAAEEQVKKSQNFDKLAKKGVKTAVGLGVGAATLGAGARLMPFLNDLIPTDLAIKGISKVNPEVGKFLQKGMSQGLDVKDGLKFVKKQFGIGSESPAKDDRSIIEQYSPELYQFLMGEIQKGQTPFNAAVLAAKSGKYQKEIQQMQKDHKTGFGALVNSVFGGGQMAVKNQSKAAVQQNQPQQAPPQSGNSDQAILAALEKILTM